MPSSRKDSKPGLGRRLADGVMTLGVMILLGGLVSAFVVVAVFLVSPVEGRQKPVPILQSASAAPVRTAEPFAAPPPRAADPRQIAVVPPPPVRSRAVDEEGYIRHWAVLAPVPLEKAMSGATEIHREQLRGEAKAGAKLEEKVKAGGRELAWRKHEAPEYFIDFKALVAGDRSDDAVAYAVCTLISKDERRNLKLQMGSNDQAKVYLNGKPVVCVEKSRTLEKGKDAAEGLTLRKGENHVVFKVINERNNWQGCLRFVDAKGEPVRDLEVALATP